MSKGCAWRLPESPFQLSKPRYSTCSSTGLRPKVAQPTPQGIRAPRATAGSGGFCPPSLALTLYFLHSSSFMALERGTRLGPYAIESPLGAGGMGEVNRAHDPKLQRTVAIKVLAKQVVRSLIGGLARDWRWRTAGKELKLK